MATEDGGHSPVYLASKSPLKKVNPRVKFACQSSRNGQRLVVDGAWKHIAVTSDGN